MPPETGVRLPPLVSRFAEDGHPLAGDVLEGGVRGEVEPERESNRLPFPVEHFLRSPLLHHAVHPRPLVPLHQRLPTERGPLVVSQEDRDRANGPDR